MSQKGARRIVRSLSVIEKLYAIDRVHNGESKAAVARNIGVPESTLRGWCKSEEKLRAASQQERESLSPNTSISVSGPPSDVPLDFSLDRTTPSPVTNVMLSPTRDSTTTNSVASEAKQEHLMYWVHNDQPAQPVSPSEVDNVGWFWKLYKTDGLMVTASGKDSPFLENGDRISTTTVDNAVYHGEKFLRWLEGCSDPSITALNLLQFRCLLKNVKDCAKRHSEGRISKAPRKRPSRK